MDALGHEELSDRRKLLQSEKAKTALSAPSIRDTLGRVCCKRRCLHSCITFSNVEKVRRYLYGSVFHFEQSRAFVREWLQSSKILFRGSQVLWSEMLFGISIINKHQLCLKAFAAIVCYDSKVVKHIVLDLHGVQGFASNQNLSLSLSFFFPTPLPLSL